MRLQIVFHAITASTLNYEHIDLAFIARASSILLGIRTTVFKTVIIGTYAFDSLQNVLTVSVMPTL